MTYEIWELILMQWDTSFVIEKGHTTKDNQMI